MNSCERGPVKLLFPRCFFVPPVDRLVKKASTLHFPSPALPTPERATYRKHPYLTTTPVVVDGYGGCGRC